jgi:hypothetical protein
MRLISFSMLEGKKMKDLPDSSARPGVDAANDDELPLLAIGSRFLVKSRGKFSRCLEGRTGTVIGFTHTKSAVRVLFDGQRYPQTLHRSYLWQIRDAAP